MYARPAAHDCTHLRPAALFSSFGSKVSATAQAYAPVIKTTVSSTLERAEALVQREKEAFVLEQKRTTVPTPQGTAGPFHLAGSLGLRGAAHAQRQHTTVQSS